MKSFVKKTLSLAVLAATGINANAAPLTMLGDDIELFVLGSATLQYQDNLFRTTNNEVDDIYLKVTPGVEVVFGKSPVSSAKLVYKHSFYYYDDNGNLDNDYSDLSFAAHYDSGLFLGKFDASFQEYASTSADAADVTGQTGLLVGRDVTTVNTSGKYQVTELVAFAVGIDYNKTDFKPAGLTDTKSTAVPLTFFYKIRPQVDLTAGYRYRTVDFSTVAFSGSYQDNYFFVGAVGELGSPKIIGDVNFGWQERDMSDLGLQDEDSFSYNIRVTYAATANARVYALVSSDYRTSSNQATTYTYGIATVGTDVSLSEMLKADASFSYGEAGYRGSTRQEDHIFFNAGVSYSPNDYLSVRAGYSYEDIDGKGALASDYTNNRISVTASIRY